MLAERPLCDFLPPMSTRLCIRGVGSLGNRDVSWHLAEYAIVYSPPAMWTAPIVSQLARCQRGAASANSKLFGAGRDAPSGLADMGPAVHHHHQLKALMNTLRQRTHTCLTSLIDAKMAWAPW